ncbi:MAG: type II secretion system minor pseudopilin GspI [Burkholderiales bacterium]|nr:type II secretion system minor pseudopilin GspI [Burkholderiales bacterium]
MASERGFTLVEVLVALAIFAVALTAALRACSIATDAALDFRERLLAGWVAENRLAEYRLGRAPELGERSGTAVQAGLVFTWRERVSVTPMPLNRRIDVQVFLAGIPGRTLAQAVGYAIRTP